MSNRQIWDQCKKLFECWITNLDVGSVKEIVSVRLRNVKLARGDDSELDHPQGFRYISGSFTDAAHQLGIEVKLF